MFHIVTFDHTLPIIFRSGNYTVPQSTSKEEKARLLASNAIRKFRLRSVLSSENHLISQFELNDTTGPEIALRIGPLVVYPRP
jgi:hypothetical protein